VLFYFVQALFVGFYFKGRKIYLGSQWQRVQSIMIGRAWQSSLHHDAQEAENREMSALIWVSLFFSFLFCLGPRPKDGVTPIKAVFFTP
jgi:hypothetical protein